METQTCKALLCTPHSRSAFLWSQEIPSRALLREMCESFAPWEWEPPLSCLLPSSLLFNMERCMSGWMDGWMGKISIWKIWKTYTFLKKKITYLKMLLSGENFVLCTLYSFLFHDYELLKHNTIHKSTKSTKTIKTFIFWGEKNLKKKCSSKLKSTSKDIYFWCKTNKKPLDHLCNCDTVPRVCTISLILLFFKNHHMVCNGFINEEGNKMGFFYPYYMTNNLNFFFLHTSNIEWVWHTVEES